MDRKHLDRDSAILVEATGDAAFAVDQKGRITAWNSAAEGLLGRPATEVLGRPCSEVICGQDLFGNLYCNALCNPRQLLARKETVNSFELRVPTASAEHVWVRVFSVLVRGSSAGRFSVAHLLWPSDGVQPDASGPWNSTGADRRMPDDVPDEAPRLTPRELEVLGHLGEGLSVSAIAASIAVSESTARTHVQNILRKCGVRSARAALAVARQHGLI